MEGGASAAGSPAGILEGGAPVLASAFATTARLVLGQKAVSDKSNETTAIPILLERLAAKGGLEGATVSIDAIACNAAIAAAIKDAGAMAEITAALRDEGISLERLIQRSRASDDSVHLILTTHETSEARMDGALARFRAIEAVLEEPCMLRIEPI